jgi:hypothetical protein
MDANKAEEQTYQPQTQNTKLLTKNGFHVDGSIDGSLQIFMHNCGMLAKCSQVNTRRRHAQYSRTWINADLLSPDNSRLS